MKRILGVDFGIARTGVAVTDPLGMMAQGVATISSRRVEKVLEEVVKYAKQYDVETIVVGLPKNMNNTIGPKGELSLEFKAKLEKLVTVPIHLQDERLTTKSATDMLIMGNVSRKDRKKVVDSVAATIILQTFLDRKRN